MAGIRNTFAIATLLGFSSAGLLAQSAAETGRPAGHPAQIKKTERPQVPKIDTLRDMIEAKPEAITVSAAPLRKSAEPIPLLPHAEGKPKNRKAEAAAGISK